MSRPQTRKMSSTPIHMVFTSTNKESPGLATGLRCLWEMINLSWDTWSRQVVFKGVDAAEITYIHLATTCRFKQPLHPGLHTGPGSGVLERSLLTAAHPIRCQTAHPSFAAYTIIFMLQNSNSSWISTLESARTSLLVWPSNTVLPPGPLCLTLFLFVLFHCSLQHTFAGGSRPGHSDSSVLFH